MALKNDLPDKGAIVQRGRETYAVVPHIPGGIILDPDLLRKIADVAEKYQAQALKLTSAQRIAIMGINEEDVDKIWRELGMEPGHAIGLCVRSIKICPGTNFCRFAQQDAVYVGLALDKRFHGRQLPSKLKIGVSGCMNSCAEPAVKDLGIMGTPKGFTIMIGGSAGMKPRIADVLIKQVDKEDVVFWADKIIAYYREHAKNYERMGMMIDRLGIEKVRQDLLG
mgnify:CR=1 FL=1